MILLILIIVMTVLVNQEKYQEAPENLSHPNSSTSCISVVRNWNPNLLQNGLTDDNVYSQIGSLYGDKNAYWLLNSAFNDRYKTDAHQKTFGKNTCVIPKSLANTYGMTTTATTCTGSAPDGKKITLPSSITYDRTVSEHEGCALSQTTVKPFIQYVSSYFGYDKQREKEKRQKQNSDRQNVVNKLQGEVNQLEDEIKSVQEEQDKLEEDTESANAKMQQLIRDKKSYIKQSASARESVEKEFDTLETLQDRYAFLDSISKPRRPVTVSGTFDGARYLRYHTDLAQKGVTTSEQARAHYARYGISEGRVAFVTGSTYGGRWNDDGYLGLHADVKTARLVGSIHYRGSGWRENRKISLKTVPTY